MKESVLPSAIIHSKFLMWIALIIIMLLGISYVGFKANKQHAASASSQDLTAAASVSSPPMVTPADRILSTLPQLNVLVPVLYSTQMILPQISVQDGSALWQPNQQQLTIVQGTVLAGVDLSELTRANLNLSAPASLQLPLAEMISVHLDDVSTYDIKTGQKSAVQLGTSMTESQLEEVRQQMKHNACMSGILQNSSESTRKEVEVLLKSMNIDMTVNVTNPLPCEGT
ncbi:DUF4230 domain-containing protein [Aquirhabdus parva]|nr:DUF4230 domain-containing protein [Aquirhabdus parva]